MIREALELIFDAARVADNPKPHVRDVSPNLRVVTLNGVETTEIIPPAPLSHTLRSVKSLADMIAFLMNRNPAASGLVGVQSDAIYGYVESATLRDEMILKLETTTEFIAIGQMSMGMSTRDLIRHLRTNLAGCVQNESIIPMLRAVEFDTVRRGAAKVSHQDESMGRTIEKAVRAQAGDIPEELIIRFPLYKTPLDVSSEVAVRYAVIIDYDAEKISLQAEAGSLRQETERVHKAILDAVEAELQGMPNVCVVQGNSYIPF